MSKNNESARIPIDLAKIFRVGSKINQILQKKTRNGAECYAVIRFLCIFYEEHLGVSLPPELEADVRKSVHEMEQM